MYEKNIVGTYRLNQEYPVFSYESDTRTPAVPSVPRIDATAGIVAIEPLGTRTDPIAQWRAFSEMLRDRRLAQQQAAQYLPEVPRVPPPSSAEQNFQKVYEKDMVNLSAASAHDPLYANLQRYLSIVNHPIPDEEKKAWVAGDDEEHPNPDGILRVADVMTRRVTCVLESTSIEQVASLCNRRGFTGVPVITPHRGLIGIVTLTDIINHLFEQKSLSTYANTDGEILEQQALALLDEPVRNYMRTPVITVVPTTPVKEACQLMMQHRIRRVVVTQGDLVKGIFSAQDAVRVLAGADLNLG
jgi:CBS domain-containing protein